MHTANVETGFELFELTMSYWAFDDATVNFISMAAYNGGLGISNVTAGFGYRFYNLNMPLSTGSANLSH